MSARGIGLAAVEQAICSVTEGLAWHSRVASPLLRVALARPSSDRD